MQGRNWRRQIAFLKKRDAGRATFLPRSTIRGNELQEKGLENVSGFVGIASTLCDCDDKYSGILRSLLGRICIADNLDNAVEIARRYSYRFRVVTLDGQVVNAGGSLTGGSLNKKTGLLSRVSEIEKEKNKLEKLNNEIEKLRRDFVNAQSECGTAEANLTAARDTLSSVREEKIRVDTEMKTSAEQITALKADISVLKKDKTECESKEADLEKTFEAAEKNLSDLEKAIKKAQTKIDDVSGDLAEQTEKREKLTDRLSELKLEIVTIAKDIEIIEGEIKSAAAQSVDNQARKKSLSDEIEIVVDKNKQTEKIIYAHRGEISRLRHDCVYNNEKIAKLSAQRAKLEKRSSELRRLERERSDEKETIGRELARLEERKTNLQKQYDEIIRVITINVVMITPIFLFFSSSLMSVVFGDKYTPILWFSFLRGVNSSFCSFFVGFLKSSRIWFLISLASSSPLGYNGSFGCLSFILILLYGHLMANLINRSNLIYLLIKLIIR